MFLGSLGVAQTMMPSGMVVAAEAFAATNQLEVSAIARRVVDALRERLGRIAFVTCLTEFARDLHQPCVGVERSPMAVPSGRRHHMPAIVRSEPYAGLMHLAVAHGDKVHLAGIVADDLSADMEGQTRDVLRQLDEFAQAQGLDRTRVLSATIYVTDMAEKPAMNRAWQAFFDPAHLPARATIGVADLGPGVRLEMVAVLGR